MIRTSVIYYVYNTGSLIFKYIIALITTIKVMEYMEPGETSDSVNYVGGNFARTLKGARAHTSLFQN